MRIGLALIAIVLTGCGAASQSVTTWPSASTKASSPAQAIRFVTPDPAQAKIVGAQAGGAFSAVVSFHEIGLSAGLAVDYRVSGQATIEYQCMQTSGGLNGAPGTNQEVKAPVTANHRFIAAAAGDVQGVVVIRPPPPSNPGCPPGYAAEPWRSSYSSVVVVDLTNHVTWQAGGSGAEA